MSLHKAGTLVMDEDQKSDKQDKVWARLVPVSQGLSTAQIYVDSFIIGRNPECTLQIHQKRLSGKHCEIIKFENKVSITDHSTNGTYLGDRKIGKNKTQQLKDNSEIWLLPASKVSPAEALGFRIQLLFQRKQSDGMKKSVKKQQQKKTKQQEQNKKQSQQKGNQQKKDKKQKQVQTKKDSLASTIKQQITCSFCFQIMYIPVSVQPCNHRFCGACLTELVEAKKPQCITCRKDMTTAVRDSIFNSIVQDYLKTHPQQKRSDKQEDEARKKNIFGHDPINIQQRINGKKVPLKSKAVVDPPTRARRGRLARTTSDLSASDDQDSGKKCRQCTNERGGFQCSSTQVHAPCHTCGKLMANRQDPDLHQYCVICTTNFCNLYFPPCSRSGVKLDLVKNKKSGVRIDAELLRGNKFEFQAIKNYLQSKKETSKEVFDFMLKEMQKKKFSYIFDKKIMKVPPLVAKEVPLSSDSAVCDLCWKDLWFQMVFAYRNAFSADFPSNVRDRPPCYWGINCRTMDHNYDHARKFNHILFQTRFS